ncbi:MAG: hypothetical protein H6576_15520 [Lewinellaceae bacterium]|nr:hypothetical protein [Saprospiraceae bacterium]MCB9345104.1 hypothetical protein [Lewinellaceae bacterium]
MPKTPSDKLYRLVASLSPTEKRYFRIFIRGKTDRQSKYLQLFETISSGITDEEKVKQAIYQDEQIEGKKFSELKAYLYDLLLKCLQSFDEQQSVEYKIDQFLQSTHVLYKRGHYQDCRDLLQKAKKIAVKYEAFSQQLEIIRWEKQLAYTQMDADFLDKNLEHLHHEETIALDKLQNAALYRKAFFEVYSAVKREALQRNKERLEQLKELISRPDFGSLDRAISHRARTQYLRTINLYHYAALEQEQFYESGQNLISLIESQPHFLKDNISDYIAALSNQVLACGLLRKYDEVRECLSKLRELKPITADDKRKIHRQYFSNYFALCTYSGEFEEAFTEMQVCQEEAAAFDPRDYETASFYYQYALISFGCGNYDQAMDYLNEWHNQPRSVEREDLQSVARMFTIILHIEMGNTVLLESLLRSATRFLKKKNRYLSIEQRFIHFVSEISKLPAGKSQLEAYRKMQEDLLSSSDQAATKTLLQTFDLDAWLESKLRGESFAAIIQKKWAGELHTD